MRILVVGGTGTVGRPTVAELVRRGHDVRVLSRGSRDAGIPGATAVRGDLATGAGLTAAMDGVDGVVDTSNTGTLKEEPATAFFVGGTRRLLAAGREAGVRHHVLLSIVGVDRVPTGYYRAKVAQEQALARQEGAVVPSTVVRATQFHEFADQLAGRSRRGPFVLVPRMTVRPVSTAEVAAALADAVEGPAGGRAPDVAGPQVLQLPGMVRALLRATGRRGTVVPLPLPGRAGRRLSGGALLPVPGQPVREGRTTFAEYLAGLTGSPAPGAGSGAHAAPGGPR
jgi:uncharacterized protein YbjT (DUF2867 family)